MCKKYQLPVDKQRRSVQSQLLETKTKTKITLKKSHLENNVAVSFIKLSIEHYQEKK